MAQAEGDRPPYLNAELGAHSDSDQSSGLCEIPQECWSGVGDKKMEP